MTLTSHHFLRQTQIRFQSEDASPGDYFTVRRESTAAGVSWYVRYARVTQLACRVPPAEFTLAVAEDFKLFRDKLASETLAADSPELERLRGSPYFFVRTAISVLLSLFR